MIMAIEQPKTTPPITPVGISYFSAKDSLPVELDTVSNRRPAKNPKQPAQPAKRANCGASKRFSSIVSSEIN